jgi:hypothetical protein
MSVVEKATLLNDAFSYAKLVAKIINVENASMKKCSRISVNGSSLKHTKASFPLLLRRC